MEPERLPLSKAFDVPFLSLDETSVEMASILFLFLAVMVIARVRWQRQWVRRGVQAASLVVFFYVVYSCLGVFGMIRNGLYGVTILGSAYTESFYWMALPAVVVCTTLAMGPVFCGWICPTGTIQELVSFTRKRLFPRSRPKTRRRLVALALFFTGFLALVFWLSVDRQLFIEDSSLHWGAALLVVVWLVVAGAADDRAVRALRAVSVLAILATALSRISVTSPVHFAFTARSDPASATTTIVVLVGALFVDRAWCRYLCPWGWLMGKLHRFSRLQIFKDFARCNDCGACGRACGVGAIDNGAVRVEQCQFCYACVDACPEGALEVGDAWLKKGGLAEAGLVQLGRPPVAPPPGH